MNKLTLKDGLECNYWTMAADMVEHAGKLALRLWSWGFYTRPHSVLDIGCGPAAGFLPLFREAGRRVGVDPNADEYRKAGFVTPAGVELVAEHFEDWQTDERFDAIFCSDALDHGEMGFQLIPRILGMLNPGGTFYLHVHLRKPEELNESHDHALTMEDFNAIVKARPSDVRLLNYVIDDQDVDGVPLATLMAVWRRFPPL